MPGSLSQMVAAKDATLFVSRLHCGQVWRGIKNARPESAWVNATPLADRSAFCSQTEVL